jgi:hypothetical protein
MPLIQYLPDIDNKMPIICLDLKQESDIPLLEKMLASPRPDGRQRVIGIIGGKNLVCVLIRTIEEVKILKKMSINCIPECFRISVPPPHLCSNHFTFISLDGIWMCK